MAYLERRISRLVGELKSGKLRVAPELQQRFDDAIASVTYHPDGSIDLASCSSWLRGVARAYTLAASGVDEDDAEEQEEPAPRPDVVAKHNRALLLWLREVFTAFTGESCEGFAERHGSFDRGMNALGERMRGDRQMAAQRYNLGQRALGDLRKHYEETAALQARGAASQGGMKFVLAGGASTFHGKALQATRSMLLYSDSLIIPDPVLPWLEVKRTEEKFANVKMLENIFYLLQLAPLVEADLPQPPIILHPTWDRSLDLEESVQDQQERLALRFFSHHLGRGFDDISEVFAYADENEAELLGRISAKRLFVAQGGEIGADLLPAIQKHRDELEQWRTEELMKHVRGLPNGRFVVLSILERLGPQYHAMLNGEHLRAAPLFNLPVHWHYFQLLGAAEQLGPEASAPTEALSGRGLTEPSLAWLGNIPIPALVELRTRGENAVFREKISKFVLNIEEASASDAARIAIEVERGVQALLQEHQSEVRKITEDAEQRHGYTAAATWITAGACFALAALADLPGVPLAMAATGLAAKYAGDKVAIRAKGRQLRGTLLGALSAANASR